MPPSPKFEEQFDNVCLTPNKALVSQINSFLQHRKPFDIVVELDAIIHPLLLKFMQNVLQRRHEKDPDLCNTDSLNTHVRRVHQLYCFCIMVFCLDPHCTYPLHMRHTNGIICHGGTAELVQVFNRIGGAASLDVHEWMIKELARSRDAESQLHESSFWVVSVDNIDILQSHAHVYTTAAERSFHGTSVQCVEPISLSLARKPLFLSTFSYYSYTICAWGSLQTSQ